MVSAEEEDFLECTEVEDEAREDEEGMAKVVVLLNSEVEEAQ